MRHVTVRARFDERTEMEEAVHALLDEGFRKREIRVERTTASGHRAPEGGSAMRLGGVVGAILAVLTVIVALVSLPTATGFWGIAFRLLGALAGGALFGALAGLVLSAIRDRRSVGHEDGARGWLVRVKTDDEHARHAHTILRTHRSAG